MKDKYMSSFSEMIQEFIDNDFIVRNIDISKDLLYSFVYIETKNKIFSYHIRFDNKYKIFSISRIHFRNGNNKSYKIKKNLN